MQRGSHGQCRSATSLPGITFAIVSKARLRCRSQYCGPDVMSKNSSQGGLFATTRWSVICSAGEAVSSQAEQAREQLCRLYWPALYAWLRREGHSPADAEDLVQGFLARFLSRNDFAQ